VLGHVDNDTRVGSSVIAGNDLLNGPTARAVLTVVFTVVSVSVRSGSRSGSSGSGQKSKNGQRGSHIDECSLLS
jgi:hypothetical protein